MWVRWLRLRLLLGVGAFACVLDRNTFRSSSIHQAHRMSLGNICQQRVHHLIGYCHTQS